MKRLLLFVVLLLLPCIALAEEAFTLTATVTAEESALLALPIADAEGYVVSKYMDEVEAANSWRIAYVEPGVNAWLRLDSRSGKNWMICRLEPGTPVQFISNPNGWAVVEVAGYRGRMLAHNLTFTAPEE